MNLSYQLGIAFEKASQGQNVTEYNTLVDVYNAWIWQNFGEDANLFKPRINETIPLAKSIELNEAAPLAAPLGTNDTKTLVRSPRITDTRTSDAPVERKTPVYMFEGELAKFGKKQITDMA